VDDARMLRESGGGEKDERGGKSELSHARLDRAAAPWLAELDGTAGNFVAQGSESTRASTVTPCEV
jgi:hypothetical protein